MLDDSYIEKWIQEYLVPKRPELADDFVEARRICLRVEESRVLEKGDHDRLLALSRSSHAPLGENVASMIGELYAKVPALGTIIRALAGGLRMHERINALVALSSHPATELHSELLSGLLKDKSAKVRTLAADKIIEHGLTGLGAELGAAIVRELKPAIVEAFREGLDHLYHGFHVRQTGEEIWVTCRRPGMGSVSRLFASADYETEGAAWIRGMLTSGIET